MKIVDIKEYVNFLMIGLIALIGSRNSFIVENVKDGTIKTGQERTAHGKMKI